MKINNIIYSNPKQAVLPMLIQDYLYICDPVLTFDRFMGEIELEKYLKNIPQHDTGRLRYDPVSMLKTVLFGFMANGYISLRELEDQCKINLRFMYLNNHEPNGSPANQKDQASNPHDVPAFSARQDPFSLLRAVLQTSLSGSLLPAYSDRPSFHRTQSGQLPDCSRVLEACFRTHFVPVIQVLFSHSLRLYTVQIQFLPDHQYLPLPKFYSCSFPPVI